MEEKDFIKDNVEEIDVVEKEEESIHNENNVDEIFENDKSFKKRIILIVSTLLFVILIAFLMYYFFFQKADLQINISTDKKFEFVYFDNEKKQLITQKYISDLGYSMRYDIENFKVFKYQEQDIYKCTTNSDIVIKVEKTSLPSACSNSSTSLNFSYNSCELLNALDNKEYYLYDKNNIYKITLSLPDELRSQNNYGDIIDRMLATFSITI